LKGLVLREGGGRGKKWERRDGKWNKGEERGKRR